MSTVPQWQPGTTYAPGALVVPRSSAPPPFTGLDNPKLTDTTGWDLDAPLSIVTDTAGYGGQGRIGPQSTTNGATALNQAHIPIQAGQSLSVSAMFQHGTGDDHSSDGNVLIAWFNASNVEIGTRAVSGGIPSLSNGGWQQQTAKGSGPSGVSYARVGAGMYKHGADDIEVSGFQISYVPQQIARAAMYEATQTAPGKSGNTEPVWPGVGQSVQDNQVTWNGVNIDRLVWQASPLLKSGDTEPDWPTAPGGAVLDGTIDWVAVVPYITDPNCPNTPVVAIMASKVFAGDKDITRFCATANALDWTTQQDAGYLPTGLQQSNSNDVAVLAPYRGNLTVFNASCFQNWQVDPDPAAMAILDQMEGIGSIWRLAAQPVGNELFYLSQLGVRSVSIAAGSDNLQNGDIGMPVDSLVQQSLALNALVGGTVRAMYYPGAGQYWLAFSALPLTVSGDLPDGPLGASGTMQYVVSNTGGSYTAEITAGALPPGATMDSTGLVTYDYTTAGHYAWTVTVTDAAGRVATLGDSADVRLSQWWATVPNSSTLYYSDDLATWAQTTGPTATPSISMPPLAAGLGHVAIFDASGTAVHLVTQFNKPVMGTAGSITSVPIAAKYFQAADIIVALHNETNFGSQSIWVSTDKGATFTAYPVPGAAIAGIARFSNGRWLIVEGPHVGTSRFWYTDATLPTSGWIAGAVLLNTNANAYSDIVCDGTTALVFTNTSGWTNKTTDGVTTALTPSLAFSPDSYLKYAQLAANGVMLSWIRTGTTDQLARTTDDGATWTYPAIANVSVMTSIVSGNGSFVASDSGQRPLLSADQGVTWTPISALPSGAQVGFVEWVP